MGVNENTDESQMTTEDRQAIKLEKKAAHDEKVAAAAERKEALRLERLEKRRAEEAEKRAAIALVDDKSVEIELSITDIEEAIKKQFTRFGPIEKAKYDAMNKKFSVSFETATAAEKACKANARPVSFPVKAVPKMNRGKCINIGLPHKVNKERFPDKDAAEAFLPEIIEFIGRFGTLTRTLQMKGFLVLEFDTVDSVFDVTSSGEELVVDGYSLGPIRSGLPKRSFEGVVQKQARSKQIQKRNQMAQKMNQANRKRMAEFMGMDMVDPEDPRCYGFIRFGNCKRGDKCKYSHDKDAQIEGGVKAEGDGEDFEGKPQKTRGQKRRRGGGQFGMMPRGPFGPMGGMGPWGPSPWMSGPMMGGPRYPPYGF